MIASMLTLEFPGSDQLLGTQIEIHLNSTHIMNKELHKELTQIPQKKH